MIHEVRAIHDQGTAIVTELIPALTAPGRRAGIPDGNGMNRRSGDSGDAFRINPMVDEVVIANIEVVDDRGAVVNLCHLRSRSAKTVWVRITKMPD